MNFHMRQVLPADDSMTGPGVDLLSDRPSLSYEMVPPWLAFQRVGMGKHSMISTESPGKRVKCG